MTRRSVSQKRAAKHARKRTLNPSVVIDINSRHSFLDTQPLATHFITPLEAKTVSQSRYITAIKSHKLTFGIGPAGTGKSYIAGAIAAEELQARRIEKIIITRPAVEAGENMGFLPGDLQEKFDPYFDAFRDCLNERLGKGVVECGIKNDRIVVAPLAYLRGKTFNDAFVVLDEAQNCTKAQLKMFLTRIGENCRVVVNGDVKQSDIGNKSGLQDAIHRLSHLSSIHVHEFEHEDIVRSGLVKDIIECYED
ncbi:Phosphate starvation-inducible protein PhoH, predicted ATPase [hydrothermal vent metagenome]|uniref:Phosphate starvation-inducible protein PhoH, predicted ATPase n=1 Tax=hydrothermal vent metagenome TaxID=652676 RepID=A0A3B0X3H7_9ZZZZ